MKKILIVALSIFVLLASEAVGAQIKKTDYTILASRAANDLADWKTVILALQQKHGCEVILFNEHPLETLQQLKKNRPRYVAIVDLPERIGKEYVIKVNQFSRQVDDDIYADFLWGIITGYNADSAMRMVKNSTEPLLIESCISTIQELESGKWFSRFAYVDDHEIGKAGEKESKEAPMKVYGIKELIKLPTDSVSAIKYPKQWGRMPDLLGTFYSFYKKYDPDLIVTASHATEYNLEMPASLGNIKSSEGVLYADFPTGKKNFAETGKRRVYLPIGNCQIANVDHTNKSMTPAWINSGVTTEVGYVVPTWYGRSGWGALKYWLTTPGRYTVAEAVFLNQQDMLSQLNKWSDRFPQLEFNYRSMDETASEMASLLKGKPTKDQVGFLHDRDVLAFYGDPKWDVRLKQIEEESDFEVEQKILKKKCVLTIKTKPNFSLDRMKGSKFKEEHVLDLPFSYFFPHRLKKPKLSSNQQWEVALDENFILIYNADFKPDATYVVELDLE